MPASPSRVVAVRVGNNGFVHPAPGINVKIAGRAVEAVFGELDEI